MERSYYTRVAEAERTYNEINYNLAKVNARINKTPLTVKDIERMSVYDFFVLKSLLEKDIAKQNNG